MRNVAPDPTRASSAPQKRGGKEENDDEGAAGHASNPPVPPLKAVNTAIQPVSQSVNSIEKLREATGQHETMRLSKNDAQLRHYFHATSSRRSREALRGETGE